MRPESSTHRHEWRGIHQISYEVPQVRVAVSELTEHARSSREYRAAALDVAYQRAQESPCARYLRTPPAFFFLVRRFPSRPFPPVWSLILIGVSASSS